MDVISTPPEAYVYTFVGAAPAMRIKPGTALLVVRRRLRRHAGTVDDLSSTKVDVPPPALPPPRSPQPPE